jgi:hypothetical protein
LFGWGTGHAIYEIRSLAVYAPQNCDTNFAQSFCSVIDAQTDFECTASLGSPLVSSDSSTVLGILISEGCRASGDRLLLNYHSVESFRDWIETASASKMSAKLLIVLFISAALLAIENLM